MMKKLVILSSAALIALSGLAYSQLSSSSNRACGETTAVATLLNRDFGESMILYGMVEGGGVLSFWASKEKRTWTIILSKDNTSCYITSGTHFKLVGLAI